MNKKSLVGILLSSVMAIGLMVGCGASNDEQTKGGNENKKYIIACDSKFAPFSFEENGSYKGIDVEILSAIAKIEGFEYELKPMDFNGIIPALTANQLDGAVAAMSITDERKQSIDFSDGYFTSGLSIVTSADNATINGANDLNGKSAAIKKGTAGSKYAEDKEKELSLKLNYFDDSPTMFMSVENGNNDFLVEDYPVIAYKIKVDGTSKLKMAGDKLTNVDYGFAVKKGANGELIKKFNDGLKKLKENGEYDKIISQYIAK